MVRREYLIGVANGHGPVMNRVMTFTIKPLQIAAANSLRALRLEALRAHADCFGSSPEEAEQQSDATYSNLAASGCVIGCFKMQGELVGMAGLSAESMRKVRHRATLWGVYLRPELRGQGAGEALVRAAIALAQAPIEDVILTVSLQNVSAVKLYERLGFERYAIDERALKLSDGTYVDEMLMRLRVTR
ncbi:MAG: GNAT family N-acetyltransferase [Oxalobacteraceae bacterium]|nr:MAG: GNAT family N-acetyltransferase [Oxalobacteraceae bacterium]